MFSFRNKSETMKEITLRDTVTALYGCPSPLSGVYRVNHNYQMPLGRPSVGHFGRVNATAWRSQQFYCRRSLMSDLSTATFAFISLCARVPCIDGRNYFSSA